MSAPAAPPDLVDDLILDPGVLSDVPTLEWHGWQVVARVGGVAVLPWRAHARAATHAGAATVARLDGHGGFAQAVVRIGKGRAATEADLAAAWAALALGGRLLIVGTNEVGITTWAKRLASATGEAGVILANRARGRVVAFTRTSAALPIPPDMAVPLPDGHPLMVAPGVFSGDGLDGGTALLLAAIAAIDLQPQRIVDVGCGAGHLGIAAARRWPAAEVLLLDADARAVACAQHNAQGTAATVQWWDDQEPWPCPDADLVVLNPPCHAGTAVDLTVARKLFSVVSAQRLLVVANRQLPYEDDLACIGEITQIANDGRFKVLDITRYPNA